MHFESIRCELIPLFFVVQVAYQRILQLTYVEDLLANIKALFVKIFEPFLATFVASLHSLDVNTTNRAASLENWDFRKAFEGWDKIFDKLLSELEGRVCQCYELARFLSSESFLG